MSLFIQIRSNCKCYSFILRLQSMYNNNDFSLVTGQSRSKPIRPSCPQCLDADGWVAGRHPACKKM